MPVELERELKKLQAERETACQGQRFDWRDAVEKFKGDADILAVLREAMKLREKERATVRKRQSKDRRTA